jgi:hypothetical protein
LRDSYLKGESVYYGVYDVSQRELMPLLQTLEKLHDYLQLEISEMTDSQMLVGPSIEVKTLDWDLNLLLNST